MILLFPPWRLSDTWTTEVVEKQSFLEFWRGCLLGYSDRQRLYQILCEEESVKYESLKQLVCDFLFLHQEAVQAIHDTEESDAVRMDRLCHHCCVYVTTVAAAILFDLNGFSNTAINRRDLLSSNLVAFVCMCQVDDYPPATGYKAYHVDSSLRAHLHTANLYSV